MMTGSGNVAPKAMLHMTPSPQLGLFMTTGARLRVQPLRPSGGWGRVFLRTCAKHSGHSAVEGRTFGGVNGRYLSATIGQKGEVVLPRITCTSSFLQNLFFIKR
ncbi:unnamed protein product [Boreogadus saida]